MDPQKTTIPNDILLAEVGRLLQDGGNVELKTSGDSMEPFIRGGRDSVLLRKMSADFIEEGDIVLAEISDGHYVLHRVIKVEGKTLTLMGDGNVSGVERCKSDKVCGVVLKIIKHSGREVTPGKAFVWRKLGPLPRRYLLALYRRTLKFL